LLLFTISLKQRDGIYNSVSLLGIPLHARNWHLYSKLICVNNVVSIWKAYFHFLPLKTNIAIIVIIIIKLHSKTLIVRHLCCGNILRCAFSLILCFKVFLCLIFSDLWMWVRRMIISMYSKLLALTEHWWMLYVKNLSLISNQ